MSDLELSIHLFWDLKSLTNLMKVSLSSSSLNVASGCGENLYSSFQNTWSNAIQSWYDEVKNFSYGVGSTNGGVVGHYTQVQ